MCVWSLSITLCYCDLYLQVVGTLCCGVCCTDPLHLPYLSQVDSVCHFWPWAVVTLDVDSECSFLLSGIAGVGHPPVAWQCTGAPGLIFLPLGLGVVSSHSDQCLALTHSNAVSSPGCFLCLWPVKASFDKNLQDPHPVLPLGISLM